MPNLAPDVARRQAEKMFGPAKATSELFELWYFDDAECEISGPISMAAIHACKQKLQPDDPDKIEQAACISVDAAFLMLGLTPEMVAGLLVGSWEVKRKPH